MNARARPPLRSLVRYFFVLGATGFGGPVALANYMRRDLVERDGWLSEEEYDRGLAVATACPGPMAYQLGVYCGYVTHGAAGGALVACAFASAPFVLVTAIAAAYVRFAGAPWLHGLFYGIGPVVVALIVKACWNLGKKTLRADVPAWFVAVAAFAVTVIFQRELTVAFLAAGVFGIFAFRPKSEAERAATQAAARTTAPRLRASAAAPLVAATAAAAGVPAWDVFAFFFRTAFLVFGSGLVVVSFIKAYVVDQYHWLDNRAFVDAVAIGMVSPGPVVITATFVGYLVAGVAGALAATVGIFLPPVIFTVIGTPLLVRYGRLPRVAGFIRGLTVAVVGVLAGTTYLVGKPVIGDALTVLIALAVLLAPRLLPRLPDPAYVGAGAAIGLAAYPIVQPAWLPH